MNEGARLDEIIHTVQAPAHLLEQALPAPIYDEPEFIVRNVWRLYGGWYDGNPAHLKPAPDAAAGRRAGRRWRAAPPAWPSAAAELAARAATCAWPATSPSSPRRPPPTTPPCTGSAPRCSGSAPGPSAASWRSGVFSWAEAESSEKAGGAPG